MGGLAAAVLLDCDEEYMRHKCTAAANDDGGNDDGGDDGGEGDDDNDIVTSRRIADYKHSTLPVLGYLENVGKLDIVMV